MSLAVVSVLAVLIVVPWVATKRHARQARCASNLGGVTRAILAFGTDHGGRLPDVVPGQPGELWWWYKEQVKGYAGLGGPSSAGDTVFACPDDRGYSDPGPFHRNARFDFTSYVFNGVTLPGMPGLAGWPVASVRRPARTLLAMEWTAHAPLSWHHSRTGRRNLPFYCDARSVVGFVDGHVSDTRIYYDGYNAAYTRDPIRGYDYQYSGQ